MRSRSDAAAKWAGENHSAHLPAAAMTFGPMSTAVVSSVTFSG